MTTRITLTLEKDTVAIVKQLAQKRNITVSKFVDNLLQPFSDKLETEKDPSNLLGILKTGNSGFSEREIENTRWNALKKKNGL